MLGFSILIAFAGCTQDPLTEPIQSIQVGMLRDEAIRLLEDQAWYYQPCSTNTDYLIDLFFFGSHEWDRAAILTVRSQSSNQEYRVTNITSFDEPNAWHTAYERCLQRDKFAP